MALSGKALDTSYRAFGALNNADLTFKPRSTAKGRNIPDQRHLPFLYAQSRSRLAEKRFSKSSIKAFEAHANTLCELIQGQVQSHLLSCQSAQIRQLS